MEELEIVPQNLIKGMRVFVNTVEYRSPHLHPEWELLWVLDSILRITSSQEKYEIPPGELIFIPPNWAHEFHEMEKPCTFLCLQFSSDAFPAAQHLRTDEIRLANCLAEEDIRWLKKAVLETAREYFRQSPYFELYCHGMSSLILHRLFRTVPCHIMTPDEQIQMAQKNARLTRLMQFVDENFTKKLRLLDFAQQEGCTVGFLSHFVRDSMNQTFQEYVNSVRFNYARRLITSTDMPMIGICYESGFSDYRYFSRSFRAVYGMTPAEYRRQARSAPDQQMQSQSIHSRERIYPREESLSKLENVFA